MAYILEAASHSPVKWHDAQLVLYSNTVPGSFPMIMKPFAPLIVLAFSAHSFGCSPAADPVAKGSAHYSIDFPDSNLGTCGLTSTAGIGFDRTPDENDEVVPELPLGTQPPTEFGQEVMDGQRLEGGRGRYVVKCRITGGENHKIEVRLEGPNASPIAGDAEGATWIDIEGHIGGDGTGSASVSYRTTKSQVGSNKPGVPCSLQAIPSEETAGAFQVSPGDARFTFLCKQGELALSDLSICEVKGTIAVRDCVSD